MVLLIAKASELSLDFLFGATALEGVNFALGKIYAAARSSK